MTVTFLPLEYGQLEQALISGLGDLIAIPVAITPERQQKVAFSTPIRTGVKQIIVTGPGGAEVTNLDDLSGKEIFVIQVDIYIRTDSECAGAGASSRA